MNGSQEELEGGEQGDYGLDLFTEQDLVDRLVQAVTDEDLYQVVFWIKRLEEKGWLENINDGHSATTMTPLVAAASKEIQTRNRNLIVRILRAKGAQLPSGDDAIWLELIRPWAIEMVESQADPENEEEKDAAYLLAANDEEAEQWISHNLPPHQSQFGYADSPRGQRSHSLPLAGTSNGRSNSLPSRYTPLGAGTSGNYAFPSSPHYKPDRESTLPPVEEPQFGNFPEREGTLPPIAEPHLGFIDLTESRSPSPVLPKDEPIDEPLYPSNPADSSPASFRKVDKGKGRASETPDASSTARAHLRIDNLPIRYTDQDLCNLFSDLSGVIEASVQDQTHDSSWGLITFKSLVAAQHAYAVKVGKIAPGGVRPLELKIYSSEGKPVEAHVAVEPSNGSNGNGSTGGGGGGERYAMGFSGGARPEGERGPIYSGRDADRAGGYNGNNNNNGGGPAGNFSHPGPMPFQGRFFPRPRVPYIFTAAELARRVFLGGLPFGISEDEVGRIFSEKAKVKARVLRVKNSPDSSHAFAFVQHPDSITADFAIKALHGQVYSGHLLQLEHVNELAHRWLFSLTLYGFPSNWEYRDVSDFLISTIGSFAGLRVSRSYGRTGDLSVRVELRYETELHWAANELNGLIVKNEPIRAEVDQIGIRKKMEREMAYERLQEKVANEQQHVVGMPQNGGGGGGGYNPYDPSGATTGGYDPMYPGATSTLPPPPNGANGGGSTPLINGSRTRPAPPPPPPPPAKRSKTDGQLPEGSLRPASLAVPEEDDNINPFSPRWMMGGS